MNKKFISKNENLIKILLSGDVDKKYQGKHIVIIGGEIKILPGDSKKAAKLIEDLEMRYPDDIPELVFVPQPETYILRVKIGKFERIIPVGFFNRDNIPPLLGRQDCFESFRTIFDKREITFQESET